MIKNKKNKSTLKLINNTIRTIYRKCNTFNRGCSKSGMVMNYMMDAMIWSNIKDSIEQSDEIYTYETALKMRNRVWDISNKID